MVKKSKRTDGISAAPKKPGRPRKLTPDDLTLKTIKGLGAIQATTLECAAMLGVAENTFLKFKADYEEVAEAYENGKGTGRVSLRRTQFRLADKNAAMAIFLGKNILGQVDKQEFTGADGGPVHFIVERTEHSRKRRPYEEEEAAA